MAFDIKDLLRLSLVPGIGAVRLRNLVDHFKDPANVFNAPPIELAGVKGITKDIVSQIFNFKDGDKLVADQLRRMNNCGASVITLWDEQYPKLLRSIYDPPPFLFTLGDINELDKNSIAIVGTRRPTEYGKSVTSEFVKELVMRNINTVSGLARGIDTAAHVSTLKANGKTIAVIGSGLDVPYPPENAKLIPQIAENGAVVSEFLMGTKPDGGNFPRRNRIISGLSLGSIIIESKEDGGALITASLALDQGREVFAVPGSIHNKCSIGTNKLIREGRAKLVTSIEHVLEELRVFNTAKGESIPLAVPEMNLFELKIYEQLNDEPIQIDRLSEMCGVSTTDALISLLSLEFKGMIKQLPGKNFVKIY